MVKQAVSGNKYRNRLGMVALTSALVFGGLGLPVANVASTAPTTVHAATAKVNKQALVAAINRATAFHRPYYTSASFSQLQHVLSFARMINGLGNTTQARVNGATSWLNGTIQGLVPSNKATLTSIIASAKNRQASNYTAASWAKYQYALEHARYWNNYRGAGYYQLATSINNLNAGIRQLQKLPTVTNGTYLGSTGIFAQYGVLKVSMTDNDGTTYPAGTPVVAVSRYVGWAGNYDSTVNNDTSDTAGNEGTYSFKIDVSPLDTNNPNSDVLPDVYIPQQYVTPTWNQTIRNIGKGPWHFVANKNSGYDPQYYPKVLKPDSQQPAAIDSFINIYNKVTQTIGYMGDFNTTAAYEYQTNSSNKNSAADLFQRIQNNLSRQADSYTYKALHQAQVALLTAANNITNDYHQKVYHFDENGNRVAPARLQTAINQAQDIFLYHKYLYSSASIAKLAALTTQAEAVANDNASTLQARLNQISILNQAMSQLVKQGVTTKPNGTPLGSNAAFVQYGVLNQDMTVRDAGSNPIVFKKGTVVAATSRTAGDISNGKETNYFAIYRAVSPVTDVTDKNSGFYSKFSVGAQYVTYTNSSIIANIGPNEQVVNNSDPDLVAQYAGNYNGRLIPTDGTPSNAVAYHNELNKITNAVNSVNGQWQYFDEAYNKALSYANDIDDILTNQYNLDDYSYSQSQMNTALANLKAQASRLGVQVN